MASSYRWPSRWWFWGPVVGMNLYLLYVHILVRPGVFVRVPSVVRRLLLEPFFLFGDFVSMPAMEALGGEVFEGNLLAAFAIFLSLWELVAAALGLTCYGAVLLAYAIVPGKPDSGDGERGQLGQ